MLTGTELVGKSQRRFNTVTLESCVIVSDVLTGMELMGKTKTVRHRVLGFERCVTVSGVSTDMELMGKSQRGFTTVALDSCVTVSGVLSVDGYGADGESLKGGSTQWPWLR